MKRNILQQCSVHPQSKIAPSSSSCLAGAIYASSVANPQIRNMSNDLTRIRSRNQRSERYLLLSHHVDSTKTQTNMKRREPANGIQSMLLLAFVETIWSSGQRLASWCVWMHAWYCFFLDPHQRVARYVVIRMSLGVLWSAGTWLLLVVPLMRRTFAVWKLTTWIIPKAVSHGFRRRAYH